MFRRRRSESAAAISTRTAWCGRRCRAATRQLRPPQVQGSAQRAECHRQSLPRGLDLLSISRPRLRRHRREQRRGELLHLGRPAQHVGLGDNIPISTANLGDGFVAIKDGKMITIRIPIRSASTPRVLTGVSTIPTPGGKAADCRARTATARPARRKVARAHAPAAPCPSSFGPDPLAK